MYIISTIVLIQDYTNNYKIKMILSAMKERYTVLCDNREYCPGQKC
jgi:hypothetical protein